MPTPSPLLSGEQKAAIFLHSIGEETAANITKFLDPKEIRRISLFLTELTNVTRQQREQVLSEFHEQINDGTAGVRGKDYLRAVLSKALGTDKAERIMNNLTGVSYPGLEALKWLDPRLIAQHLKNEHPQSIAVILAYLEPDQASATYKALPAHLHADVAYRLATLEDVRPDALQQLSDVLQESLSDQKTGMSERLGGPKTLAGILNQSGKSIEEAVMGQLAKLNTSVAERVRAMLFIFEDFLKLDDRGIQEIHKETGKDTLAVALKGTSPDVKEKFTKNMSSRAAQMLLEDMEARGPVKVSEVERAQQAMITLFKKLEAEGKVVLPGKDDAVM